MVLQKISVKFFKHIIKRLHSFSRIDKFRKDEIRKETSVKWSTPVTTIIAIFVSYNNTWLLATLKMHEF